jgi:hypothetical protein
MVRRELAHATTMLLLLGFAETATVWLDRDIHLTRDQLADQFARICTAAIGTVGESA